MEATKANKHISLNNITLTVGNYQFYVYSCRETAGHDDSLSLLARFKLTTLDKKESMSGRLSDDGWGGPINITTLKTKSKLDRNWPQILASFQSELAKYTWNISSCCPLAKEERVPFDVDFTVSMLASMCCRHRDRSIQLPAAVLTMEDFVNYVDAL